jgi:hypothetical protein
MWKIGQLAAASLGVVTTVAAFGACADIIGLQDSNPYPGDAAQDVVVEAGPDDAGGCPAGSATCNGQPFCATKVLTDPSNCGACGKVCGIVNESTPPACVGGACAFTCTAGFAHCRADPSTGCESDLRSDSKNCGACGHDCLRTACSGGLCAPTVIVPHEQDPYAIAVDATNVYWTSLNDPGGDVNSSIRAAHKDGTAIRTLAGGQCVPVTLMVTDTALYWGNQGQCTTPYDYALVGVHKDGTALGVVTTAGAPIVSLAPSAPPFYFDSLTTLVTTDAGVNYWAVSTLSSYSWDGGLRAVATASGPVYGIGTSDAGLYWTEQGVPVDGYRGGRVQFLPGPTPSGSPVTLGKIVGAYGLAIQDSELYATMPADGGGVYQLPLDVEPDGGPPTLIVSTPNAGVLLGDAAHLYWNDDRASGGSILRARRDGSEVIPLATNISYGSFIAMDDQYVYWTERGTLTTGTGFVSGDGAVLRVAK